MPKRKGRGGPLRGKSTFIAWYHTNLNDDFQNFSKHPPETILRMYVAEGHTVRLSTIRQWMKEALSVVPIESSLPPINRQKERIRIDAVSSQSVADGSSPTDDQPTKDDSTETHRETFLKWIELHPGYLDLTFFGIERFIADIFSLEFSVTVDEASVHRWMKEYQSTSPHPKSD